MAQTLADQFGGNREKRERVASIGFMDGEFGNVMTALDAEGQGLFDFAWRPHKPSPENNNYTNEGLFLC
jgi:hypothetical protein